MENLIMNDNDDNLIEMDIKDILYAIRKNILMISMIALLFACAAACITKYIVSPSYTSETTLLVLTKNDNFSLASTSLVDLQLGSQLTSDYEELIKSRTVLQIVIDNLKLDMDYMELEKHISIQNPTDTRLLNISVSMPEAKTAMETVNELAAVASEFIGDSMDVTPPKIVETGLLPVNKSGPNMTMNIIKGFLLGAGLVILIIIMVRLADDTIQTEDDIQKYLGIVTLAVVPNKKIEKKNTRKTGKNNKGL